MATGHACTVDEVVGWQATIGELERRGDALKATIVAGARARWEAELEVQLFAGRVLFCRTGGVGVRPMDAVELDATDAGIHYMTIWTRRLAFVLRSWRGGSADVAGRLDGALDVLASGPLRPEQFGWRRHDALVYTEQLCSACGSPAGNLLLYRHRPSGRLFLMCWELGEAWWEIEHLDNPPEVDPWTELEDWDLANEADLRASGWDSALFKLKEKWWIG